MHRLFISILLILFISAPTYSQVSNCDPPQDFFGERIQKCDHALILKLYDGSWTPIGTIQYNSELEFVFLEYDLRGVAFDDGTLESYTIRIVKDGRISPFVGGCTGREDDHDFICYKEIDEKDFVKINGGNVTQLTDIPEL